MAGNAAIWWVKSGTATPGTETKASLDATNWTVPAQDGERLLFNESPVVAAGGVVFNSEFRIRNSVAENARVDGNGNDVQDMGLDGIDVQITGMVKDSDASNIAIQKMMQWINEAKTTTGYTEGRFGLRIDDFPYFNLVPVATYGYVLNDITFIRDPNKDNKVGFVLTLRVGGNIRAWLDANGYDGE